MRPGQLPLFFMNLEEGLEEATAERGGDEKELEAKVLADDVAAKREGRDMRPGGEEEGGEGGKACRRSLKSKEKKVFGCERDAAPRTPPAVSNDGKESVSVATASLSASPSASGPRAAAAEKENGRRGSKSLEAGS